MIYYSKNFKPKLLFCNLHFSISHTTNLVACAISNSAVGLDVEKKREFSLNLAKRIFNEKELINFLNNKNRYNYFFEVWTKKESFCKKNDLNFFANLSILNSSNFKYTKTFSMKNYMLSCSFKKNSKISFYIVNLNDIKNILF